MLYLFLYYLDDNDIALYVIDYAYIGNDFTFKLSNYDTLSLDEYKGTDYNVVGAPDTGMSAAQTIYFIGLIVLLCGVGIVYANAKPIENN